MEILKLLCEGRSNPKIAEQLAIGTRPAKFRVQNIIEKLGVADRKQDAERAAELGILTDER
jgi:ATP/maltotriose-dependent transcriptional regulator MalT